VFSAVARQIDRRRLSAMRFHRGDKKKAICDGWGRGVAQEREA
jgi:hypothetical protein